MTCPYCHAETVFEPGVMMIEDMATGNAKIVHEECYQQSGDDEGYVERLHKLYSLFEDEDGEEFFGPDRIET